ncbi:MAG: type I glyceraldehyde-3-phosphate dehydrogenase [Candidatus Moranbacteria bacterium]|nr:type I glyceraldehyde-3-phosphate dehydrogenase [Candidatus Moranbacteria bacterium]
MIKLAINGFGRIGRSAFKAVLENEEMEVVAINDLSNLENLAYLLKYDSAYGKFNKSVEVSNNNLVVDGREIRVVSEKDPKDLPWKEMSIDVVLECTGFFTDASARGHLDAGAKEVVISAPTKDESIKTVVMGVNENDLTSDDHIISNASCTTNCLAPMMKVLDDAFGVEKSLMSTIHSYTAKQTLIDTLSEKDMRVGRSGATNIIPSSTGAAIATTKAIPHLEGNFDGMAFRVPILVGSVSDLTVVLKKNVTEEKINEAFKKAAEGELKGIMEYSEDTLVSHDVVGNSHSVVVQPDLTKVIGGNLAKVVGWYDNEWGYSKRLVEMAELLAKR